MPESNSKKIKKSFGFSCFDFLCFVTIFVTNFVSILIPILFDLAVASVSKSFEDNPQLHGVNFNSPFDRVTNISKTKLRLLKLKLLKRNFQIDLSFESPQSVNKRPSENFLGILSDRFNCLFVTKNFSSFYPFIPNHLILCYKTEALKSSKSFYKGRTWWVIEAAEGEKPFFKSKTFMAPEFLSVYWLIK